MKAILKYTGIFLAIVVSVAFIFAFMIEIDKPKLQERFALSVIQKDTNWIYEIKENNKLLIRQEVIPAVKGKQFFKSERDAEIIGELVLTKLLNNQIPKVTIEEVISNSITFNKL